MSPKLLARPSRIANLKGGHNEPPAKRQKPGKRADKADK